ncbi:MAG TPA: hypothetical protein PKI11_14690, partial [Candidatus Hydrogenedentes bacterium]|nr:hypothetical protein [Candidatus Hydrogenedentota bacterium]
MFFAKSIGTKTYAVACALTICVMALAAVPATAQENAPLTLPFLQCMPKQTAVALGLPPLNNLVATLLPIVDRIAPELGAKDVLDGAILDASIELGLDADNLAELGKELGLDLDAPIVAFVDVAPTVKSIEEIQAKVAAEREAYEAAKAAEAAESAEESAEPTPMSDFDEAKAFQKALDKMLTIPAFTVVLGVSDAEKAETTLKDLGVMYADLDPDAFENVSAGDVTMKSLGADNFNYFIAENKLALSNSVDLAANTALRLKEPATLRYGTAECPAIAPNEISLLFYGADFLPALMAVAGAFQNEDPTTKALIEKQVGNMAALWEGDAAHDPLLVTLGVRDNRLELTSRLDTAVHPAALTQSGEAKPLRYAPMLSENTLLFLSLFLTPEIKTMLSEMVIDTIVAQSGGDARMAQGVTMGKQVLQMIGPEVTLGLAAADDFPSATLMIGLENPEATKGLLQMFVPTMPEETHNEVEINSIVAGIPVPLSIAYLGDMVLVSNSIDEMKRIIDLSKAEKHSDLFASLKPALDPATPRYNALLLKTSLYTDVVEPLANLFGALPADAGMIAGQVAAAVDEVRIVSEMNGSWQKSGL